MDDVKSVRKRVKRIIGLMKRIEKEMIESGNIIDVEISTGGIIVKDILMARRGDHSGSGYFKQVFPDFIRQENSQKLSVKIDGVEVMIYEEPEEEEES